MSAFLVGPVTMTRTLNALHTMGALGEVSTREAARYLWTLNEWALNERYPDTTGEPPAFNVNDCAPVSRNITGERRECLLAYKAMACLSYQCAEGAAYDSDAYAWLDRHAKRFARFIVLPFLASTVRPHTDEEVDNLIYGTPEWQASGNWGD